VSAGAGSRPIGPAPTGPWGGARSLPRFILPVALVGLATLMLSLLPALVARRRLRDDARRLALETAELRAEAARVSRERSAMQTDLYVLDRTVRELMEPGRAEGRAAPRR
jgi:hypothetical protein